MPSETYSAQTAAVTGLMAKKKTMKWLRSEIILELSIGNMMQGWGEDGMLI